MILADFLELIFPSVCVGCEKKLNRNENLLCIVCQQQLPQTNFHKQNPNKVLELFVGRCAVEHAAAFLYYTKKGLVQKIMHQFKYNKKKELGVLMGTLYGRGLVSDAALITKADLLIPVPLDEKKLRKRGYNQAEFFAQGLASQMHIPVQTNVLVRKKATTSQTKKGRYDRWKSVENIYDVVSEPELKGKHLVLVDDVITTGSTMEACVQKLNAIEGAKVSVLTMAYTHI